LLFDPENKPKTAPRRADRGFLQLCSDRRFHLKVMEAFEELADLDPDEYWIEARPGGAPAWADNTKAGRLAYREGAAHMGWAAHGDECAGFPGQSNADVQAKLERTLQKRASEFPLAAHVGLFALGDRVEVVARIEPSGRVAQRSRRVKISR
jgi:hypothetical protein